MLSADAINGAFEAGGAAAQLLSVRQIMRVRRIAGVSWPATGFFTAWGLWNLFYYPHLGQPLSFAGGGALVCTNVLWLSLVAFYARRPA